LSKSYLPLEALAKLWELLFGYLSSQSLLLSAYLRCKQQPGFTRVIIVICHWELLCLCIFICTGGEISMSAQLIPMGEI